MTQKPKFYNSVYKILPLIAIKSRNLSTLYLSNALFNIILPYTQYDLVRKPSTLDALIGYFTPSHVIHQRLLQQFLSAPEDGRKNVRNM